MKIAAWFDTLRGRLAGSARARPRLRLQALGLSDRELKQLRPVVAQVGERLGVAMELDKEAGDIVVVDSGFAAHVSPHALRAYCESRPLVALDPRTADDEAATLGRVEQRQQELLRQLRELPIVRRSSAHYGAAGWDPELLQDETAPAPPPAAEDSGFDSGFDSRLQAPALAAPPLDTLRQRVVTRLLAGLVDPSSPALALSYGPGACLWVDFDAGLVRFDPPALQQLRVRRELPTFAPGARPGEDATVVELEQAVWDIGLACGAHRLLEEPQDWWHTPLEAPRGASVQRYTRQPRHLALAQRLFAGPVTPSQLRREAQVSVPDLRRFLQASLFVGVAYWAPWQRTLPGQ